MLSAWNEVYIVKHGGENNEMGIVSLTYVTHWEIHVFRFFG